MDLRIQLLASDESKCLAAVGPSAAIRECEGVPRNRSLTVSDMEVSRHGERTGKVLDREEFTLIPSFRMMEAVFIWGTPLHPLMIDAARIR